jgi:hypothetical protein
MNQNKKKMETSKLPFSKTTVLAARYESYIVAILLFLFVWFDKDVSAIAILASLSWSGYRLVQNFYIWMAKNEHIMDKKIEYKKIGLNSTELNEEEYSLEHQDLENFNSY